MSSLYDTSEEEFDMEEEEDLAMILAMHINKKKTKAWWFGYGCSRGFWGFLRHGMA